MSLIKEKQSPQTADVLTRLYSYLTKTPEIDQEYLTEILLGSQKRNLAQNTLEILQTADLSQIDLLPILQICFQKELTQVEFELIYQMIVSNAIPYLSFRGLMTIHQYIKNHPELQNDDLLIKPFDAQTGSSLLDLSPVKPIGPINYLIDSPNVLEPPSEQTKEEKTMIWIGDKWVETSVLEHHQEETNQQEKTHLERQEIPPRTLLLSSAGDDYHLSLLLDIAENFPNIVIAGGFTSTLMDGTFEENPQSDLDIFIFGDTKLIRKTALDDFLNQFQTFMKPEEFFYRINGSVVNIWFENSKLRPQIILSQAPSLYHLLNNFDLQFNSWAYHPFQKNFVGILQSYYALRTRTTFVNGSRIAPMRLLKAHYKNYRVIKYQPFCFSNNGDEQSPEEYFTEDGLNLENLSKVKSKEDYHYDYWVGNSINTHQKNFHDLRTYHSDFKDQIKSSKLNGLIDSKQVNPNGIVSGAGYNSAANRCAYLGIDLSSPPELDLTTELKFVENPNPAFNSLKSFNLNQNFAGQTGPLKLYGLWTGMPGMQEENPKFRYAILEVLPSKLQTYLNLIDQQGVNQFMNNDQERRLSIHTSSIKKTFRNRDGEILDKFPNAYRFKTTSNFKVYDVNGKELKPYQDLYDPQDESYVIVDICDVRLYQRFHRKELEHNMICLYISRLQFC